MRALLACLCVLLGAAGCRLAPGAALSSPVAPEGNSASAEAGVVSDAPLHLELLSMGTSQAARTAALRDELNGDFARAGAAYLAGLDDDVSLLADLRRLSAGRLLVAADGSGDHDTLAEALAAAEPFATIVLAPGRYPAGLVLQQAVSIVAEGAERGVIEPNQVWLQAQGPVLTSEGPWLRLMGVGLSSSGPGPTLQISGGHADLTDITFSGGGLSVSRAAVFLSDSRLTDLGSAAVVLSRGARATIERTRISAGSPSSPPPGLVLGQGCQLDGDVLRLHGLAPAVSVAAHALLTLTASDLYNSIGPGVEVASGGEARLMDVVVRDGDDVGVLFRAGSRGQVERCRLRGNRAGQLHWEDGANVEQRDNVVRRD